jgi:hypothetical protein
MRHARIPIIVLLALLLAVPALAQWPRAVYVELGSATW